MNGSCTKSWSTQPNPERSEGKKRNPNLRRVLLLFSLLALAYGAIVPFGEPPDEPSHYAYIWHLLNRRQLPLQSHDPTLNLVPEGHHPPGYYAVVALLTGWAPYQPYEPDDNPYLPVGYDDPYIVQQFLHPANERFSWKGPLLAAHIARLVSIGMGLIGIWATYQIGKQAAPHNRYVALLAAGTCAFIPQFLYMNSAINNDNAAMLMGSLITWQLLRLLLTPTNTGFALLGVLMGLGMLSKVSLLAMFPAIGWVVWCAAVRSGRGYPAGRTMWMYRLRTIGVKTGLVLFPMMFLSGWWMWRNLRLYNDPVGWNIWMITNADFARRLPITWGYVTRFWWQQFRSFWGVFGWGRVSLPPWLYIFLLMLTLLGAGGILKHLSRTRRRDHLARMVLLVLVLVGFLLSTWRLGISLDFVAAQGRFLFPALSAIATLLAIGWLAWWPLAQRGKISGLFVGGLFTLSAAVLLFRLVPVYSCPPILTELPAKARPVQSDFELWELVGWQAPRPVAGQTWPVTFYWRAQRELDAKERQLAPVLFVHLIDANGETIVKWDGVPTQGRLPPPAWGPDDIVADTIRLPIPDQDKACLVHLFVGFYFKEDQTLRRVTVRSSTHPTLPGTLVLGPMMLRATRPPQFHPQRTAQARFGPIRLQGFDLESEPDGLRLVLYWQAEGEIARDHTVFVHLIGAKGLVAQGDAHPCDGGCPTSLWQAGDVWRDEHFIPLTSLSAADAPYTLSVGWYDPSTGARLPAFSAQGSQYKENRLSLCAFFTWPDGECQNLSAAQPAQQPPQDQRLGCQRHPASRRPLGRLRWWFKASGALKRPTDITKPVTRATCTACGASDKGHTVPCGHNNH